MRKNKRAAIFYKDCCPLATHTSLRGTTDGSLFVLPWETTMPHSCVTIRRMKILIFRIVFSIDHLSFIFVAFFLIAILMGVYLYNKILRANKST
jgi:hypothetical protein